MRQLNLSHLALRKGLSTFAHTRQRFVVRPPVAGLAPRKSRSRTVDLRSDRPAGVYETIRYGRDAFIYPHRGKPPFASVSAHQQNTGFCSASRRTGVRIQQGSECLAEFAFRNAFRHQLQKCLAPVRQHGFAMHLEGDWRTCASGCSAVGGRSTCVQTVRLEHMKRFDTVEMFS